jgi:hypothetical protein
MADTAIAITAGTGTNIDTRTEATNGNHRQVVVLGDPATNAGVAPVDATNGLSVTLTTALPAGTAAIGKLAANTGVTIGAVEIAAAQTLSTVTTVGAVTAITNALPAGTNAIGKLAANTGVDIGDVDVTSIVPGTGATNLGKAEDAAHASGDVGVMALAVRSDTPTAKGGTDGDYTPILTDSAGRVHTKAVVTKSDGTIVDPVASIGGGVPVVNSNGEYETVAASQTAQAIGATGAAGDYIAGILVIPATTSPGNVLLLDNATSITVFTGGASSVSNLVPFYIPLGYISVSGAWKITTGANVSCIAHGNFT